MLYHSQELPTLNLKTLHIPRKPSSSSRNQRKLDDFLLHHVLLNPHPKPTSPLPLHRLLHRQRLRLLGLPRDTTRQRLSLHHRSTVSGETTPARASKNRTHGSLGQGSPGQESRATNPAPTTTTTTTTSKHRFPHLIALLRAQSPRLSLRTGLRLQPLRLRYVVYPSQQLPPNQTQQLRTNSTQNPHS